MRHAYGDLTMNIHTDSIFMGALGAAMLSRRNINVDLPAGKAVAETEGAE